MRHTTRARSRALAWLSAIVLPALGMTAAPANAANTTITSGPPAQTNSTSATFTFTSGELLAMYVCSLDGSPWASCSSPKTYSGLAQGTHTFRVGLANESGGLKEDYDSRTWTVDLTSIRQ